MEARSLTHDLLEGILIGKRVLTARLTQHSLDASKQYGIVREAASKSSGVLAVTSNSAYIVVEIKAGQGAEFVKDMFVLSQHQQSPSLPEDMLLYKRSQVSTEETTTAWSCHLQDFIRSPSMQDLFDHICITKHEDAIPSDHQDSTSSLFDHQLLGGAALITGQHGICMAVVDKCFWDTAAASCRDGSPSTCPDTKMTSAAGGTVHGTGSPAACPGGPYSSPGGSPDDKLKPSSPAARVLFALRQRVKQQLGGSVFVLVGIFDGVALSWPEEIFPGQQCILDGLELAKQHSIAAATSATTSPDAATTPQAQASNNLQQIQASSAASSAEDGCRGVVGRTLACAAAGRSSRYAVGTPSCPASSMSGLLDAQLKNFKPDFSGGWPHEPGMPLTKIIAILAMVCVLGISLLRRVLR